MSDLPGIEDVAPAGSDDGLELTPRERLAGKALVLTGAVYYPESKHGEWWRITATIEETGEQVAFAGATVLNKQIKQVKESGVLPPIGQGVRAMLIKVTPESGNAYWVFQTPDKAGPRPERQIENAPPPSKAVERTAEVQGKAKAHGVEVDAVIEFIKALESGGSGKVGDLTDDDYATLLAWLNEQEVPF